MPNEFRVRPVTRYIVTHHISDGDDGGSTCRIGEFEWKDGAERVAKALSDVTPGSSCSSVGRTPEAASNLTSN